MTTTVDGEQTATRDFVSIDPATGHVLDAYEPHDPGRVDTNLRRADTAYRTWRDTSIEDRSRVLAAIADNLQNDREQLALLATREMGKVLVEAEAEIDKCSWTLRYVAEHGAAALCEEAVESNATESYVGYRPLGVVLAVMPWNFPYWQVMRFGAGALLAGNSILLKHAENVTGCALAIEEVVRRAGGPDGLLSTSLMPIPAVHECIADPRVAAVTLTGSTRAGRAVAASAGRALKKSVLELGGSDAFVVLADADLEKAATVGTVARFQNAGQTCIAAKRFIVESSVAEQFTALLLAQTERLVVGDPLDRSTRMGPLAREDLRRTVHEQVQASIAEGARLVTGGQIPEGPGWFYPPTLLTGVQPHMTAGREEVFGPVAAVMEADDVDEALRLANASAFGLGGNIWTRDLDRGKEMARRFESGSVFINGMTASDARLPFGGIKQSGYGRELSPFGIREFTNVQTTWIGPNRETTAQAPAE